MGNATLVLHFKSGRTINQDMATQAEARQASDTLTKMMSSGRADTFTLHTGDDRLTVAALHLEAVKVLTTIHEV